MSQITQRRRSLGLLLAFLLIPALAQSQPTTSADQVSYDTVGNKVRSVAHRLQEMLNVVDFGAKGRCHDSLAQDATGAPIYTQDDTAAFNAAVQAASETGKILYIPHGDYCVESIDARNLKRLHIVGASWVLRTRIVGRKSGVPILDASGTENLVIEGIKFDPAAFANSETEPAVAIPSCAILLGRTVQGGGGAIIRDIAIWGRGYTVAGICSVGREGDFYERVSVNIGILDEGSPRILFTKYPLPLFPNNSDLIDGPNAGIVMFAPALAAYKPGTPLITIVEGQDISIVGAELLAPPPAEDGHAQIEAQDVKNLLIYGGYNERLGGSRKVDYIALEGQSEGILLEGIRGYRPVVKPQATVDHFALLSTFLADTMVVEGRITNSWLDLSGMGLQTGENASIVGSILSGIALQQEVPELASGNHLVRANVPVPNASTPPSNPQVQEVDKTLGRAQRVLGNLQRKTEIFNKSGTIAPTVDWVLAKPTTAPLILTLPSAALVPGQSKTIKKIVGNLQTVLVMAANGESIDDQPSVKIEAARGSIEMTSDGTAWWITNGN